MNPALFSSDPTVSGKPAPVSPFVDDVRARPVSSGLLYVLRSLWSGARTALAVLFFLPPALLLSFLRLLSWGLSGLFRRAGTDRFEWLDSACYTAVNRLGEIAFLLRGRKGGVDE